MRFIGLCFFSAMFSSWLMPAYAQETPAARNAMESTFFEAVVDGGKDIDETLFEANVLASGGSFVMMPEQDYLAFKQAISGIGQGNNEVSGELMREQIHNELIYIILLCALSIISTIIVLWFMRNRKHDAKDIVNAAGLNLIIIGTIILVLVVDTSEQLTAAIGILGAIAGYLFRSMQDETKGEESSGGSGV